jgi:hypothetical protein
VFQKKRVWPVFPLMIDIVFNDPFGWFFGAIKIDMWLIEKVWMGFRNSASIAQAQKI